MLYSIRVKKVTVKNIAKYGVVFAGFLGIVTAFGACLDYEPAVVSLSGTLAREVYPGRPNYESIADGDEPEAIWVLKLDAPICINDAGFMAPAETSVTEIQLVLTSEQYQKHADQMGGHVTASGTLFHEHNGHHHKTLLLNTSTITQEPGTPAPVPAP